MYLHVRTSADPTDIASAVRTVLQNVNSSIAIIEMDSMRDQVGDSLWQERLFARLTSAFSALALTLAYVGLYGTLSYGVGRRRSEIAVRMALGARYVQVLWIFLRQAVVLGRSRCRRGHPAGALGWPVRLDAAVRPRPMGSATIGVTALLLIAVASLAGYLPARRAALTDPAVALKQD